MAQAGNVEVNEAGIAVVSDKLFLFYVDLVFFNNITF